jgi:Leucine-rich repeat (LRR) protein
MEKNKIMKKLLLIFLCLPIISLAQQTYVPDDSFEAYLETNGLGNGIINDDSVNTNSISYVSSLTFFSNIPNGFNGWIYDLTGIEDFTALTSLDCGYILHPTLTSIDLSQNTSLVNLDCSDNQLTSLDLNSALQSLDCSNNQIISLDISNNTMLSYLNCSNNQLTSLDLRNGNNLLLEADGNINLTCANVDEVSWSNSNWTNIDSWLSFSTECNACNLLDVTCVVVDSLNMTIDIVIYDGGNGASYPYIAYTIDYLGDTVQTGTINSFGNSGLDTSIYSYSINSLPTFPLTINYIYGLNSDTCILNYSTGCQVGIYGCVDSLAFNYDSSANVDNGSCIQYIYGCTDTAAINFNISSYNVSVNIDDGSCIGVGHQTYVPDDNFEQYLETNGMGNGIFNDDSVLTSNIYSVTALGISPPWGTSSYIANISDLTGIEGFTSLDNFFITNTQITSLDLSYNTSLTYVLIRYNQLLISLDVSGCTLLTQLLCDQNQLLSLDVSQNTSLISLKCYYNQISSLDISQNTSLLAFNCSYNSLTSLNAKNGTYISSEFGATSNPNLLCIDVDDIAYATANYYVDSIASFSLNCIVPGCTDSLACNYDINATISDSSCSYASLSIINNNVSCNGFTDGSVVATANGGVSPYQYSLGGGLSQASGTFSNLTAGTYFIDVTDINGCSSNQIVTITEPNLLFVNAFSTDISCFGYCDGSAFSMSSGGTPPYSYLWSNGNITDNISGLCAGVYVVNITDANNCVNIETVVISEPPPIVLNNTINGCDSVLIVSNYYTISGAYTDTLTSVNGCDSVVNTNLTIGQNTYSYDTLSVGASIVWNGMPLNVSGDYSVTLINLVGCDSIVNLNLTVTTTGISDIANNKSTLVKITDMLGQETPYRKNTPLFYIYDDGTVEKRIVIE